jgi:Flp pilus assembly protein TadG
MLTGTTMRYRLQPGQSLVEFALIAIVLITLLLGLVDFAFAYSSQIAIRNAVAEGGYYAIQHPNDSAGIQRQIESELANRSFIQEISITVTPCETDTVDGNKTTILATYRHNLLFSYLVPSMAITLRNQTVVPQLGC